MHRFARARTTSAGLWALANGLMALAGITVGPALAAETAITCTNRASGATFQIAIDYDRKTVDQNAARISDGEIAWHDPKDGGNYTLDRKTGNLTVVIASSTGGYFLHDVCKLDH